MINLQQSEFKNLSILHQKCILEWLKHLLILGLITFQLQFHFCSWNLYFCLIQLLHTMASLHAIQGMGALTSICWGWIGATQFVCCRNTGDDISHTISRSVGQRSYPWVVWIFSCICTMARGLFHRFASYVKLIQPMSEWYVSYHLQLNRSKV